MPQRPLFVTGDPVLLDDLLRLSATAGVEVEVAPDPGAARASWPRAPLVLVGVDAVPSLARAVLPRRPGVVLVPRTGADERVAWDTASRVGAEAVQVLPTAESLLVERLAAVGDGATVARTVAVVPGCGGAGASTVAAALALTATRLHPGSRSLLVDLDPYGGGLDLLLGAESTPGLRWPALAGTRGRTGPDELRAALPAIGGTAVLSWDRGELVDLPVAAAEAVLAAGRRGHDLVVLDVPRFPDPVAAAALGSATSALLVVPADVRSTAAAARVARSLQGRVADVRLVVRESSSARLPAGPVARAIGLPLAGRVGVEPGLGVARERGEPPGRSLRGPLATLCRTLLTDVVGRPDQAA